MGSWRNLNYLDLRTRPVDWNHAPAQQPSALTAPIEVATSTAIAGALLAAEPSDTMTSSGGLVTDGALAASEGGDQASIAAALEFDGVFAAIEPSQDGAAVAGSLVVAGSLAATEQADAAAMAGATRIAGAVAAVETADQTAIAAALTFDGAFAAIEPTQDDAQLAGVLAIGGSLVAAEGQDEFEGLGAAGGAESEPQSTPAPWHGGSLPGVWRTIPMPEPVRTVRGLLAAVEVQDEAEINGATAIAGVAGITEEPDSLAAAWWPPVVGNMSATERQDRAALSGEATDWVDYDNQWLLAA